MRARDASTSSSRPSSGWLLQAIIHIGELSAVVALASGGAAGRGRIARMGLGAAIAGQLIMTAAELIWPNTPDLGDVLFSVAPILTGAGLVTTGVATIRAREWAGSPRFLPLALGMYTILVLIPVMIGTGGPPARSHCAPSRAGTCCGSRSARVSSTAPGPPYRATRHRPRSPSASDVLPQQVIDLLGLLRGRRSARVHRARPAVGTPVGPSGASAATQEVPQIVGRSAVPGAIGVPHRRLRV
jgi:hypothetical protein